MLCDRVCILRQGEVVVSGSLRELLVEKKRRSEVTIAGAGEPLRRLLAPIATGMREVGGALVLEVEGDEAVRAVVERALSDGARLESITPKRETLEDLFVREAL
jgi:ABC-2 type transport system ATP-binding protein